MNNLTLFFKDLNLDFSVENFSNILKSPSVEEQGIVRVMLNDDIFSTISLYTKNKSVYRVIFLMKSKKTIEDIEKALNLKYCKKNFNIYEEEEVFIFNYEKYGINKIIVILSVSNEYINRIEVHLHNESKLFY